LTKIFIGNLPSADVVLVDGADPVRVMIEAAVQRADRERAEEASRQKAVLADAERERKTRLARRVRRMRKALRQWLF
jgi:hypothetical protein